MLSPRSSRSGSSRRRRGCEDEAQVADVPVAQQAVERGAAEGGELAEDVGERAVDEAPDEIALVVVVGVEGGDHAWTQVALRLDRESGRGEGRSPVRDLFAKAKVGV